VETDGAAGLFAIRPEIFTYGEKSASAVRIMATNLVVYRSLPLIAIAGVTMTRLSHSGPEDKWQQAAAGEQRRPVPSGP